MYHPHDNAVPQHAQNIAVRLIRTSKLETTMSRTNSFTNRIVDVDRCKIKRRILASYHGKEKIWRLTRRSSWFWIESNICVKRNNQRTHEINGSGSESVCSMYKPITLPFDLSYFWTNLKKKLKLIAAAQGRHLRVFITCKCNTFVRNAIPYNLVFRHTVF